MPRAIFLVVAFLALLGVGCGGVALEEDPVVEYKRLIRDKVELEMKTLIPFTRARAEADLQKVEERIKQVEPWLKARLEQQGKDFENFIRSLQGSGKED